jgi:GTP diphosphokinase / guanosine-3',5'-bis(diphosphate) 3'-diphosphatase
MDAEIAGLGLTTGSLSGPGGPVGPGGSGGSGGSLAGAGSTRPAGAAGAPGAADRGDEASRALATRLTGSRLAQMARRRSPRTPSVPPELRRVIDLHRCHYPKADVGLIVQAFDVAGRMHSGQTRHSGEPYITHPVAVTEILAGLGVDTTTIVGSLLHDTVEDTAYTLRGVQGEFGAEVANLVDGVTKLDRMRFGDAAEAETLRKLIVALARDYRVLLIKIADRLHNMRTLGFKAPAKQVKIARVTLEVLAPLAHRLGVSVIKRELEDRSFAVLYPEESARISEMVERFAAAERQSKVLATVADQLGEALLRARIESTISVRPSHLFSIYKRARERDREPTDYNDIVRVLVLVNSVTECYAALGVVHSQWRPVPGRLRDFVAAPKFNMYQSLHTTVLDPTGRPVDIQIRTEAMDQLAETGIIARPVGPGADGARLEGLAWLHSLLDWQGDADDPREFLESLSSDLDSDEVLAFTPKGKVIALPARSTPLDVGYAVHTELGHRAIGARVNGRLVPLHTRLRNGDLVEILKSDRPDAGPSEDWLSFVKTSRAKVKIRRWLSRQRRAEEKRRGVEDDRATATATATATITTTATAAVLAAPSGCAGDGAVAETMPVAAARWAGVVSFADQDAAPVRLARCCLPLPGDPVVGFTTSHSLAVSVHREECANAAVHRDGRERVVVTSWTPAERAIFPTEIAVEAFDRHGLLADITETLCDISAAVRSASTITTDDRVARLRFTVEVVGPNHLADVLEAVRTVPGVYDCYRARATVG